MRLMRLVVVAVNLLALLAACAAPQPSPAVTSDGQALPESTVPASPTPETTFTTMPEGPFSRTQARYIDYMNRPSSEDLRNQLGETLIADISAYLDAEIDPNVPLDEQQDSLARIAVDLPGWDSYAGEMITVDVDPEVGPELAVIVRMGCVQLLYGRYTAGEWRMSPVPWPDNVDINPNLRPSSIKALDLTGDGHPEFLAMYTLMGGSGYWDFVQAFQWIGEDFALLFRADLLTWAGESRYALEPDPTQSGAMQIVLTYPHLYNLGFDHKMVNHPLGRQVWRWDAGVGRFVLAESEVDLERSAWGEGMEVTVEDLLRWLVNEGETRFRQGEYDAALPWYAQVLVVTKAEDWQPAGAEPHWPAFASFRRAQLLLMMGQIAEGRAAMQPIANSWPGDPLSALAQAYLEGYGEGGADAAERAVEAMRAAVDLEDHFYHERPGLLRFPMTAEGILFSGVVSLPPAPQWSRVGTFD